MMINIIFIPFYMETWRRPYHLPRGRCNIIKLGMFYASSPSFVFRCIRYFHTAWSNARKVSQLTLKRSDCPNSHKTTTWSFSLHWRFLFTRKRAVYSNIGVWRNCRSSVIFNTTIKWSCVLVKNIKGPLKIWWLAYSP